MKTDIGDVVMRSVLLLVAQLAFFSFDGDAAVAFKLSHGAEVNDPPAKTAQWMASLQIGETRLQFDTNGNLMSPTAVQEPDVCGGLLAILRKNPLTEVILDNLSLFFDINCQFVSSVSGITEKTTRSYIEKGYIRSPTIVYGGCWVIYNTKGHVVEIIGGLLDNRECKACYVRDSRRTCRRNFFCRH